MEDPGEGEGEEELDVAREDLDEQRRVAVWAGEAKDGERQVARGFCEFFT